MRSLNINILSWYETILLFYLFPPHFPINSYILCWASGVKNSNCLLVLPPFDYKGSVFCQRNICVRMSWGKSFFVLWYYITMIAAVGKCHMEQLQLHTALVVSSKFSAVIIKGLYIIPIDICKIFSSYRWKCLDSALPSLLQRRCLLTLWRSGSDSVRSTVKAKAFSMKLTQVTCAHRISTSYFVGRSTVLLDVFLSKQNLMKEVSIVLR